jgi:hypothetical protein
MFSYFISARHSREHHNVFNPISWIHAHTEHLMVLHASHSGPTLGLNFRVTPSPPLIFGSFIRVAYLTDPRDLVMMFSHASF